MRIAITAPALRLLAAAVIALSLCGHARANPSCDFFDKPTEKLFQLHKDGSIFVRNDRPCKDAACVGGWFLLDHNPNTASIAGYCELYQMHKDGAIFHYTGRADGQDSCQTRGVCLDWEQLDQNQQTKAIAVGVTGLSVPPSLFQLHSDGAIFRRNNTPCKEAACPGGWDTLDLNPNTAAIAAGLRGLYQMHRDGSIFRWDGKTVCDANGCRGWALLHQGPNMAMSVGNGFYRMEKGGGIFHYVGDGTSCTSVPCPGWEQIAQDATTKAIKAANSTIYRLRQDGVILQRDGNACADTPSCLEQWTVVDANQATVAITAGAVLYQMHSDGSIFQYLGIKQDWTQLDDNRSTAGIVVNDSLFSR